MVRAVPDQAGLLAHGNQAALHGRHGDHVLRAQVDDALDVGPGGVDRGVQGKVVLVHAKVGCALFNKVACGEEIGIRYSFMIKLLSLIIDE